MRKIIGIAILFLLADSAVNATDYYIAASGKADNTGTDMKSPWPFEKAQALVLNPGDRILFRRGDNFKGDLKLAESGKRGEFIAVGAYGPGGRERPVINGQIAVLSSYITVENIIMDKKGGMTKNGWALIYALGKRHGNISIKNCVARNHIRSGISSHMSNAMILDNEVYNCSSNGVGISDADRCVVKGNYIHDIFDSRKDGKGWPTGYGLKLVNGNHCELSYNTIENTALSGIDLDCNGENGSTNSIVEYNDVSRCGSALLTVERNALKNIVRYNKFHDAPRYSISVREGSNDCLLHHNIVYNGISSPGIRVAECTNNTRIYNNTVYQTGPDNALIVLVDCIKGTEVRNNIFYGNGRTVWQMGTYGEATADFTGFDENHNCWYNGVIHFLNLTGYGNKRWYLDGYKKATSYGSGSIYADPSFQDPLKGDFSLNKDSPCTGKGVKLFDWQEKHPDLGAGNFEAGHLALKKKKR